MQHAQVSVHNDEQAANHHSVHLWNEFIQFEDVVDVLTGVLLCLRVWSSELMWTLLPRENVCVRVHPCIL